jgi:DNA-binding response OmpR family regulator
LKLIRSRRIFAQKRNINPRSRMQTMEVQEKKSVPATDALPAALKLLLVEDDKLLSKLVKKQLTKAGYEVDIALDGELAEISATTRQYDLMVLDINIPKKNGLEVLESLRKAGYSIPVLILTAKDKAEDRVKGLRLGADDYLGKPFDSAELLERIQAILRRSGTERTSLLQAGDVTLDLVKRTVMREGKTIRLTPKEFDLLAFFIRNKNQIVTRRRLAEQVWGYTFDTGTNVVDVYVGYLRENIDKDFRKKLIQTVRGEGFIFNDE